MKLLFVCSISKQINLAGINEILSGLAVAFVTEFETVARTCDIDFDVESVKRYDEIYTRNPKSLIARGVLAEQPVSEYVQLVK